MCSPLDNEGQTSLGARTYRVPLPAFPYLVPQPLPMRKTFYRAKLPSVGIRATLDSWKSALTGLGGSRDKRVSAKFERDADLDDYTLDNLYHNNDLAALICDVLPEDGLRRGIIVKIEDDPERQTAIQMRIDEIGLIPAVTDAAVWGNVFGGGCILLGADDGQNVAQPLDLERTRGLKYLTVLDKRDLQVAKWYANPLDSKYGLPETYRFTVSTVPGQVSQVSALLQIHETRLVFFWGSRTSKKRRIENKGWPHSKLQKVTDVLRDFEMGWAGAALLLQEASQAVYGVKNLTEILASENGEELLQTRMTLLEMSRSIARALVIDADGETFERQPVSFTGLPDLLDRFCQRLSAATHIPITRLMGTSPTGMQATGDSDQRNWNKQVRAYQEQTLKPALEKIVQILLLEQGAEPEEWSVEFPPLSEPTEAEQAQIRKAVADTDSIYIDKGVYTPEEVAISRFSADGWSMETTIDLELREEDPIPAEGEEEIPIEIEEGDETPAAGAKFASEGDVQKTAFNGTQVSGLIDIVSKVANKEIPRESGVEMILVAYPVNRQQAEKIMSDAGKGFAPERPELELKAKELEAKANEPGTNQEPPKKGKAPPIPAEK